MINNEVIQVLLADDDKDDCTDFLEAFESLKIKTVVNIVHNGEQLMTYLKDLSDDIPHLLFLDLNMPKKSGLECLVEIKKMKKFNSLTVVIYSTSSSEKDIENTFLNGANIYLKKPTHLTVLKKTLLRILTIDWQYHTDSLNRDNYLFRI